ncbi:MAG: hypothetical protein IPF40_02700 [Actinomycetales bacterium]|uniref:Uncharacterized protein n=1 Tax=Candidatus Phosphoribacter hodrii TaxID=2953743 RepID=A0A934X4D7_9MICO|nr:hypothetical protein [Candidatus Phosphoribacter hodrii]
MRFWMIAICFSGLAVSAPSIRASTPVPLTEGLDALIHSVEPTHAPVSLTTVTIVIDFRVDRLCRSAGARRGGPCSATAASGERDRPNGEERRWLGEPWYGSCGISMLRSNRRGWRLP